MHVTRCLLEHRTVYTANRTKSASWVFFQQYGTTSDFRKMYALKQKLCSIVQITRWKNCSRTSESCRPKHSIVDEWTHSGAQTFKLILKFISESFWVKPENMNCSRDTMRRNAKRSECDQRTNTEKTELIGRDGSSYNFIFKQMQIFILFITQYFILN